MPSKNKEQIRTWISCYNRSPHTWPEEYLDVYKIISGKTIWVRHYQMHIQMIDLIKIHGVKKAELAQKMNVT